MFPAVRHIKGFTPYKVTSVDQLDHQEVWSVEPCEHEPSPDHFFVNGSRQMSEKFYWKARTVGCSAMLNLGLVAAVNELIAQGVEPYVIHPETKKEVPVLFAASYPEKIPDTYRNPLLVDHNLLDDDSMMKGCGKQFWENGEDCRGQKNARAVVLLVTGDGKTTAKD